MLSIMILTAASLAASPAPASADVVSSGANGHLAAEADQRSRANSARITTAQASLVQIERQINYVCDADGNGQPDSPDCALGLRQEVQALWDGLSGQGESIDQVELTLYGTGGTADQLSQDGLVFQFQRLYTAVNHWCTNDANGNQVDPACRRGIAQRLTDVEGDVTNLTRTVDGLDETVQNHNRTLYGEYGTAERPTGGLVKRESYGLLGATFAADLFRPELKGVYGGNLASGGLFGGYGRENGSSGFLVSGSAYLGSLASYGGSVSAVAYLDDVVDLGAGFGLGASYMDIEEGMHNGYAFGPRAVGHVGISGEYAFVLAQPYVEFGLTVSVNDSGHYISGGGVISAGLRFGPN